MPYLNLPIANQAPCESEAGNPGVYYVDLHYRGRNGLVHDSIQVGDQNPLDFPIGELSTYMLEVADGQNPGVRLLNRLPTDRLVGMSVLRACTHEYVTPKKRIDHLLQAEKVASFGFVRKVGDYRPAKYPGDSSPSMYGVAHMRIRVGEKGVLYYAQHLEATPREKEKYAVKFAVPAISAQGTKADTWLALRPISDAPHKRRNSFTDRLVTREELLDTQ